MDAFDFDIAQSHLAWVMGHQGPGLCCLRSFGGQRTPAEVLFTSNRGRVFGQVNRFLRYCEAKRRHVFYSANSFSKESARREFANGGRLAFVDADDVKVPPVGPRPDRVVQTSLKNYQFLYVLDRVVTCDEGEEISRYLTEVVGGDKGGHHAAKLLRLPGTRNFKPKYSPPPMVTILETR